MVQNALAALAVAGEYGISMEMAAEPLCRFEGFRGRQQIVHLNGVTVIDDSYNASRFHESGDRSTWLFAM